MTFRLSLEPSNTGVIFGPSRVLPEDVGHPYVLVMQGCDLLAEAGARFTIEGFGQVGGGFDVDYDLPIVVEQIPALMDALAAGDEYELWIYSQGVERAFVFCPEPDEVKIHCRSGTDWTPVPETEVVGRVALQAMLVEFVNDFVDSLQLVDQYLARLEPFAGWRRGDFSLRW